MDTSNLLMGEYSSYMMTNGKNDKQMSSLGLSINTALPHTPNLDLQAAMAAAMPPHPKQSDRGMYKQNTPQTAVPGLSESLMKSTMADLRGPLSAPFVPGMNFSFMDYGADQAAFLNTPTTTAYGSFDAMDYGQPLRPKQERYLAVHPSSYASYSLDMQSPVGQAPMMMSRSFSEQLQSHQELMHMSHLSNHVNAMEGSNTMNAMNSTMNSSASNTPQMTANSLSGNVSGTSSIQHSPPKGSPNQPEMNSLSSHLNAMQMLSTAASQSPMAGMVSKQSPGLMPMPPSRLRLNIPMEPYYGSPHSPQIMSAVTPGYMNLPPTPTHQQPQLMTAAPSGSPAMPHPLSGLTLKGSPQLQPFYGYGNVPPMSPDESSSKRFVCPHPGCARVFPRQYNLKSHMLCHSGMKPHICSLCKAAFARKHDLQRHLRTLHSGNRPHECPLCKQGFNRLDTLRKHLKSEEKQHLDLPEIKALLAKIEAARLEEEAARKRRKEDDDDEVDVKKEMEALPHTPQLINGKVDEEMANDITWPGYLQQ